MRSTANPLLPCKMPQGVTAWLTTDRGQGWMDGLWQTTAKVTLSGQNKCHSELALIKNPAKIQVVL